MTWSRRRVLAAGGALAGVSAAGLLVGTARSQAVVANQVAASGRNAVGPDIAGAADAMSRAAAGRIVERPKRIALLNLHTDERLDIEYFRDGVHVPEALSAIEVLLRDFRTGERHPIDPGLMDYLVQLAHTAGVDPAFSVISGYRSPQTNARLHERSTGVAQHSLHIEGRAIDVRMTTMDCADLAAHALGLKRGGVGYYRASDFVHLDTGAFRTWRG
jgi:uncharacterized protein YcbK (DUF882 family)